MNIKRIPVYLRAVAKGLLSSRPRDMLRLLSGSPFVVKYLPEHDISILVVANDPAISKPILCLGGYEDNVARTLLSHVTPRTRFLDIGANIGYFSLLVARHAPEGRVISFEPDPGNCALLRASTSLNGLDDIITSHNLAVSDRDEMLHFSDLGDSRNIGARFTAKEAETLDSRARPGTSPARQVQAVALDSFLADQKVDLVKVDVEGFEPAVFRGMQGLIQRNRPVIVSEFAPGTIQHISKTDPRELLQLVFGLEYDVAIIEDDGHHQPMAGPDAVMNHIDAGATHHLDLLLTPKERAS